MDGATAGMIGAILGSALGVGGAVFGCWCSYRAAETEAQRVFLRRVYAALAVFGLLFLAAVFAASTGLLPRWVYWAVMVAAFLPMPFLALWLNARLAARGPRPPEP
ncbi:MAG: hypothetical protein AAF074_25475 [Pseudomonadota bacterium]